MSTASDAPLLDVKDLTVAFAGRSETPAVDGVSFTLRRGETLGLVGESGSGKSTVCLAAMGLLPRGTTTSGSVAFDGVELLDMPERQLRTLRGKDIGLIYQDPMAALNPVKTIGAQLREPLQFHLGMSRRAADERTVELLERVGVAGAKDKLKAFPHEFSGGMRQRVVIAMAVSCNPRLLIADEPTTALDVNVQAHVLELLQDVTRELGIALLFISHDLSVVAGIAQRVSVMRFGKVVEAGDVDDVFGEPQHEYTRTLIDRVRAIENAGRGGTHRLGGAA